MSSGASQPGKAELFGRAEQCALIDGALDRARAGTSAVLLMTGEPGVGKTALLEYAVRTAAGMHVVRAAGAESEMELAFAGLHQLCAPVLSFLRELPGPQQAALETAFGVRAGGGVPPDPFFVGLGALGLLSASAARRPLLCLVDDVQWLDQPSARALAFVARRLDADAVALIMAGREPGELAGTAGQAELRLAGLAQADARALLATVVPGWVTPKLADRIISQTRGNPLALLELPRGMTSAELAVGFGVPGAAELPGRIQDSFRRRVAALPEATRRLALIAAAEPTGDAALLWRACDLAGIDPLAAEPAEDAGLIEVDAQVRFFHPLVRSAVYQAATPRQRREAHAALAAVTSAATQPDVRAWHEAQATVVPDEEVAAELEQAAQRARSRGGLAGAAAFLERAAVLSPDPERRAARALAAAQAWHRAGGHDAALGLLEIAEAGPLSDLDQARAEWLRAQVINVRSDGMDGAVQLLRAAQRLEPLDRELARATYVDALEAALNVDPLPEVGDVLVALPLSEPPDPTGLLLHGWGLFFTEGFPHGVDLHRQAVEAFVAAPFTGQENARALSAAIIAARSLWNDTGFDVLSDHLVTLTRDAGTLSELPTALVTRGEFCSYAGDLDGAVAAYEEADAIKAGTGVTARPADMALSSALRDEEGSATAMIEPALGVADGLDGSFLEFALSVLYNGLARYPEALAAALRSRDQHPAGGFGLAMFELVEAAARCDEMETARGALEALSRRTQLGGTDWALGVEAHCRALLAPDGAPDNKAEDLYREAVERLGRTRMRLPLARAHLAYGEWLRRERRRGEAREQLRVAHELFEAMGARSFAGRAQQELAATGVTVHSRRNATLDELTPRELRVATMAGEGLPNAEIAARLYISVGTVEYHLNKVYRKLRIRSRTQLHLILAPASGQD